MFLYVQLLDPHTPYRPRAAPFLTPSAREIGLEELRSRSQDPEFVGTAAAIYRSEIFFTDQALARLLHARDRSRRVVVTSDHGEEFLEHGGLEHGHSLYDELLHVPLITSPRISAREPMPLAALPRELSTWLGSGHPDEKPPLISEALLSEPDGIAVQSDRGKLLASLPDGAPKQYFDLRRDPAEQHPLPPQHPDAAPLREALRRFLQETPLRESVPFSPIDEETAAQLESLGYTELPR